jgi:hypothetical protein
VEVLDRRPRRRSTYLAAGLVAEPRSPRLRSAPLTLRTHPDARGTPIPQAVSASGRRLLKSPGLDRVAEIYDEQLRLAETESLTHTDIQWTTELGNALLAPQSDVMDAGQRMRKKAQGTGALKTTEQRKVETKVVEQPPAATSIALPRPTIGTGW